MIWLFIDYISERLEKRKYRVKKKGYRDRRPDKMDYLITDISDRYRLLKNMEDGEEIVRYIRVISDDIQKDALDRFILSYRQWCRNHGYQYEELTLNRDIYDYLRGCGRRDGLWNQPSVCEDYQPAQQTDADSVDTLAPGASVQDEEDGKTLLDSWCVDAEGDDLLYEEMLML